MCAACLASPARVLRPARALRVDNNTLSPSTSSSIHLCTWYVPSVSPPSQPASFQLPSPPPRPSPHAPSALVHPLPSTHLLLLMNCVHGVSFPFPHLVSLFSPPLLVLSSSYSFTFFLIVRDVKPTEFIEFLELTKKHIGTRLKHGPLIGYWVSLPSLSLFPPLPSHPLSLISSPLPIFLSSTCRLQRLVECARLYNCGM